MTEILKSRNEICCSIFKDQKRTLKNQSVLQTQRVHPFPFRTRKLSSAEPKILYRRRYGKIGRCRHFRERQSMRLSLEEKKPRDGHLWGCSSAGRAPALQAGGHGFESHHLHQSNARVETSSLLHRPDSKGKRNRANFRWTFATAEDRARSSRETESHHLHQSG